MPSFHQVEPFVAIRERTFDADQWQWNTWNYGRATDYLRLRLDGDALKWFIANEGPDACRDFTIYPELEGDRMPVNADPRTWFRVERRTHWAIAELNESEARELAECNGASVCWPLLQGLAVFDAARARGYPRPDRSRSGEPV